MLNRNLSQLSYNKVTKTFLCEASDFGWKGQSVTVLSPTTDAKRIFSSPVEFFSGSGEDRELAGWKLTSDLGGFTLMILND